MVKRERGKERAFCALDPIKDLSVISVMSL